MKFCGIDNGIYGSIALLNPDGSTVISDTQLNDKRTLDVHWAFQWINDNEPDYCVIEVCHNNNPLVEMGGKWIAVCELMSVPIMKVAVNKWKKATLGISTKEKKVSIAKCMELYPSADLNRPTPKLKKVSLNADRAEALLLAHWLKTHLNDH